MLLRIAGILLSIVTWVVAVGASAENAGPGLALLAATPGRAPDYVPSLIELLRPRIVVPHHFDDFFLPISEPTAAVATSPADLELFAEEVRAASERFGTDTEVRRLGLFERLQLVAD